MIEFQTHDPPFLIGELNKELPLTYFYSRTLTQGLSILQHTLFIWWRRFVDICNSFTPKACHYCQHFSLLIWAHDIKQKGVLSPPLQFHQKLWRLASNLAHDPRGNLREAMEYFSIERATDLINVVLTDLDNKLHILSPFLFFIFLFYLYFILLCMFWLHNFLGI